ncbi:PfkB family carbohydrate kinase [Leifsonia xyli]|uniref:PfkB family carbohydrate kinase n=1 Tax=Leifsonia xyli TaxID=1575 RepID=UPI003D679B92
MAESPRLVFTGNVIVDIVMAVDRMPEPGGDVIASSSELTAGGGFNTMVAAQRDGLDVVFAGQYGTGMFGSIVRAAITDAGFELAQDGLPDVDSGYTIALVDASAERTFVTARGAEGRLTRADLDRVAVREQDLVYVSGYSLAHPVNAESLPGWLEALPPRSRVLFDPSPLVETFAPALIERILARTDILSTNAREARLMTGETISPPPLCCWLPGREGAPPSCATGRRAAGWCVPNRQATRCWCPDCRCARSTAMAPETPTAASSRQR